MDAHFFSGVVKELADQQAARRVDTRKREDAEVARRQGVLDTLWKGVLSGDVDPSHYAQIMKDQMALGDAANRPSKKGVKAAFTGEHEQLMTPFLDALTSGSIPAEGSSPAGPFGSAPPSPSTALPSQPPSGSALPAVPLPEPPTAAGGSGPTGAGSRLRFTAAPPEQASQPFNAPFRFIKDLPPSLQQAARTAPEIQAPTMFAAKTPQVSFDGATSVSQTPIQAPPVRPLLVDKTARAIADKGREDDASRNRVLAHIDAAVKSGEMTPQEAADAKQAMLRREAGIPVEKAADWQQTGNTTPAPYDFTTPDGTMVKKGDPVEGLVDRATGRMRYVPSAIKAPPAQAMGDDFRATAKRLLGRDITDVKEMTPEEIGKVQASIKADKIDPSVQAMRNLTIELAKQKLATNQNTKDDTGTIAQMVYRGDLPVSMLSKRTANYNDIIAQADAMAKADGKKFSPATEQLRYEGAKRFITSLNAPQQIQFQRLGVSVVNTIDEVNSLADAVDNSGVKALNWADLQKVVQTEGNTERGKLVARYIVAVNTVKEEFANLVAGGYAPTGPAFDLANKQFNEYQGSASLKSALTEVQRLVNYRLRSADDLRPQTGGIIPDVPGGGTIVAPPQVLAAGPGTHTFANGQTWTVSADGKSATQVKK